MHDRRGRATLFVLASGSLGGRIARLAAAHAEFDPDRRRVVCGGDFDSAAGAAAVMVNARGEVCEHLDAVKATAAAWIEDAFLRACRERA
jgi:hypothetical protein